MKRTLSARKYRPSRTPVDCKYRQVEHSGVKIPDFDRFFVLEAGLFAFYVVEIGIAVLQYRARRLALAYNSETLVFFALGEPEYIMRWAAKERELLRNSGLSTQARDMGVIMLPRDLDVADLNPLMNKPELLQSFLQKLRVV